MKRWLIVLTCLINFTTLAHADICTEWNALFLRIRDFSIPAEEAKAAFLPLHAQLRAAYAKAGIGGPERTFPVRGYDYHCGVEGKAYRPRGFQFFTGNPGGIHPSIDLFVHDQNQDSLDDQSKEAVTIVAFSGGVVVSVNTEWEYPDPVRGGKYLWIFDPTTDRYTYYAHLSRIDVHPGQIVQAGEPLGLLGRTGLNAYKKRSPTHLHLTVLAYQHGEMVPYNPWPELVNARVR